jgi:deazaflavin-dependent oxidoreductase (nitroreductase family)
MAKKDPLRDHQSAIRFPYPEGLLRLAFRAPILLYRLGLGWLLSSRFLLLEHRGRRSGTTRRTVIEVVDLDPQRGSFFVVSAWGKRADWYRNVLADPAVGVSVSSRRFPAMARTVTPEEAALHLRNYAKHHPTAFRELGSLLVGEASRDLDTTIQRFVDAMPMVEFAPSLPDDPARVIGDA